MKPFNLEAAKAGWPICTRDGRPVRFLCDNRRDPTNILPVVALVTNEFGTNEEPRLFRVDGGFLLDAFESINDLMMDTKRHEVWVIVHKADDDGRVWTNHWNTEDEARLAIQRSPVSYWAGPFKLEWEEEFSEAV